MRAHYALQLDLQPFADPQRLLSRLQEFLNADEDVEEVENIDYAAG
jgi:hypothetical protein